MKLNQAIQAANLTHRLSIDGDSVTVAEALETRKRLTCSIDVLADQVCDSAYKTVIHKEERDIVRAPKQPFEGCLAEYTEYLRAIRSIVNAIHHANHTLTVDF